MRIKLPPKFDDKLTGNYRNFVENSIENFSEIYNDNKLIFFPEFTNHGINHIEEVLLTASNLITDESYEFLNNKDIAVLVMSIILHDVGMHISNEGLSKLLNGEYDSYRIEGFDLKTWKELWNDFFHEAKRFNEEQLLNIFGTTTVEIKEPDLKELNSYTIKIYGEFLRRYHHRLAHEIAIAGFPTKVGIENLKVGSNIESEIINLCGLVARSHGMNLRSTFDYLKDEYDEIWKAPFDIKIFFLMVVLRISDYMQIHSSRASGVLVKTKRFSSPVSKQEWEKHQAIKDISINTDDPERIFVNSKPENSVIYLELVKLFTDIQNEFDLSWAVLGEVYGKDSRLKNLKINYRRITSNLDNKTKLSRLPFIPEKIRFNADPELLKLLIGPLYGEDPKYGIRELLQNSVDAVKERQYIEDNFEDDVSVLIDETVTGSKKHFIIIKDNGVGMTQDTIINFFFNAGASFRNSMVWKKSFVEENEVQVEKTGRFGVGVLAAFLLGSEFELTTRHYTEDHGYKCKATLSTKQVELLKCDCEIGTLIKIILDERINLIFQDHINYNRDKEENSRFRNRNDDKSNLDWFNWYQMDKPKIKYEVNNKNLLKIFNFTKDIVSSNPENLFEGWYKFTTKDFKSIQWSIGKEKSQYYYNPFDDEDNEDNDLICNGFKITRGYKLVDFPWKNPIVSVFDGNAKMPLSLNRDYLLNDRLPFENDLIESICEKIIDVLLLTKFKKVGDFWVPLDNWLILIDKVNISNFIVVKDNSYTLMIPSIFKALNINLLYQLWIKDNNPKNLFKNKNVFYQAIQIKKDPNYFYKELLEQNMYSPMYLFSWFSIGKQIQRRDIQRNSYILNDKYLYMKEKNRLSLSFRNNSKSQLYNEKWSLIKHDSSLSGYDNLFGDELELKNEQKHKKDMDNLINLSVIDRNKLSSESFYFINENFIDLEKATIFNQFNIVWEKKIGKNYLIPISEA